MSRLQYVCNQLGGGRYDMTAVSREALEKYRRGHIYVANAIYYTLFDEDKGNAERAIKYLEILKKWNFPDRNGRLSDEEKEINNRLQQELNNTKL